MKQKRNALINDGGISWFLATPTVPCKGEGNQVAVRINIEARLWTDPRFEALEKSIGEIALKKLVKFWLYAQERWADEKLVPREFFPKIFPLEIIECGFAVETTDGVKAVGSEKNFNWLLERKLASRKGGETTKKLKLNKINAKSEPNGGQTGAKRGPNGGPLTLTLTLPLIKEENIVENAETEKLPQLAILWNERMTPQFPSVKGCSAARLRRARDRWRDHPTPSFWEEVFDKIKASKFLSGTNDRAWKANFDWLLKPDSAIKVLEGSYSSGKNLIEKYKIKEVEELKNG